MTSEKSVQLRPLSTLFGGKEGVKERQRGRDGDIWLCLLTVGLASLKINKFFDDKEPIDSLIPSLPLSHSLFSTALLSFPLSLSFFALAVSKGVRF